MATNIQSTLRLQSGATVSSPVNPTGATVTRKAASQAPTVVIQATGSGGNVFNYKDDCYIFDGVGIAEAINYNQFWKRIGAGKVVNGKFTGLMTAANSYAAAMYINSLLTGANRQNYSNGAGNPYPEEQKWCGTNRSCAWCYTNGSNDPIFSCYSTPNLSMVVIVNSLPIANVEKCYP